MGFPKTRPAGACYPRPQADETLDISPPGFCWWPAGERGAVAYRLKITDQSGTCVYESPVLEDPAHAPDRVLAPGDYAWTVEALDKHGAVLDSRSPQRFRIAPNPIEQPWIPAEDLLARVPREHPRLIFPKAQLAEIRSTLNTTRREAFQSLKRSADKALSLTPPPEPDYGKIKDPAVRRMAYKSAYSELRKYHQSGMVDLALMYALSGERKYGEAAKAILLGAADWDPEGISSVMSPYGDEVGLGLAKSAAQAYDWVYDLLTEAERAKVKQMLIARADQVLRRLQKRNFLASPEESHSGRLPGYLVEHAIALAEEPRARVWMDYAMRVLLTVFPHWAGQDGGWAEGIPYGLAYNTIYLMPFESLRHATGFDLWQRPFYRKIRYFFLYCISPRGDIMPFGDTEDAPATGRASGVRSLLQFHANLYHDPAVRWWVDHLGTGAGAPPSVSALPGIILPDEVAPQQPADLAPDAAFFGVGWAALHSDILNPDQDLMVLFKSSPYGAVSHSHADQNSFAILKGGKALAIPGGKRYPIHGSPFHTKYTQQTLAHNAILVDGQGQINREGRAGGQLTAFETKRRLGYVCGDAQKCYGDSLTRCTRHVLMIRPSMVCVVDDLGAPTPAEFQWLLHGHNEFELDEPGQTLVSRKDGAAMTVYLITPGGFSLSQTNEWPMSPKEGYPKAKSPEPQKQWHVTAAAREKAAERRIAAVMLVEDGEAAPNCEIHPLPDGAVEIKARLGDAEATVRIHLAPDPSGAAPILEARCQLASGEAETISAK